MVFVVLLYVDQSSLPLAGLTMEAMAGSRTSVHVGCFTSDYSSFHWRDTQRIPKYSATGASGSILSNRISWFYDFRGPSMTIDTACSSSMVALDLACKGLWNGSSDTVSALRALTSITAASCYTGSGWRSQFYPVSIPEHRAVKHVVPLPRGSMLQF